jgi:predicted ATPase/DNA-binding CsgD family transcriptional regulator
LQQKQLLLLLDNFEQVVTASVQVATLLAACLQLKILVTSRQVLHVRGEREFAVQPLELPDPSHLPDLRALSHNAAVALFIQRAQAVKPDFELTSANARAIAEICVRLDGLPLAIELAAARVKLLPPQALLARLDQRLAVLASPSPDVPPRQQTLRNTISWSYNLLDAAEQQLFRWLSILVDGCSLRAVETLCTALDQGEAAGQLLDRLASLIDKSLVQQVEQEGQEPHLVMLETIREYGLERLTIKGELEATQRALAALGQSVMTRSPSVEPSSASAVEPVPTYPDGLTAREVEVLRLMAQGLSDAQIAKQLVISPRTVNGHLRSIYSKIGVTSRSAATRYAMDRHLA